MNILIIQGHPDPAGGHLCHALAEAYANGARAAGHALRIQTPAEHQIAFLRNQDDFKSGAVPEYAQAAQQDLLWAGHIVLIFPLWLGSMPARLKAWMEQTLREGFAFQIDAKSGVKRHLKGRSVRLIVPMGAPAWAYRLIFGAFGLRMLRRSVLWLTGVGPVRQTIIGGVGELPAERVEKLLARMADLGRNAA
ncbi:flavodoxin family protein [Aliishimia ponticola]|uniref:Flavodoxin family protein n=1 Tax=Aliishimia ponticola TaxID=2499833 RepID=A0A4V3XKX8_9RHOB|nr:NAD(P)H-dependent oxidoreductase [Aliishimia ponticola]THH38673.1 flavodoxin family protein [Aliishimia ponticola]